MALVMTMNSQTKDMEVSSINLDNGLALNVSQIVYSQFEKNFGLPKLLNKIEVKSGLKGEEKFKVNYGNWAISKDGSQFSATLRNKRDISTTTVVKNTNVGNDWVKDNKIDEKKERCSHRHFDNSE